MEYEWNGDGSREDGEKPQCELMGSREVEPDVL